MQPAIPESEAHGVFYLDPPFFSASDLNILVFYQSETTIAVLQDDRSFNPGERRPSTPKGLRGYAFYVDRQTYGLNFNSWGSRRPLGVYANYI